MRGLKFYHTLEKITFKWSFLHEEKVILSPKTSPCRKQKLFTAFCVLGVSYPCLCWNANYLEVQASWINLTFVGNGEEFDCRKNLSFRILPKIWAVSSEILSYILASQTLKAWKKSCTFYLKLKWQVANSENLLHQVVWKLISESSENVVEEIFSNSVCALTSYKQQCCEKNKEILVLSHSDFI